MAKLFLDTTDTSYKVSNSNTEIFGANGTQAITIDGALTGIVLDANVERVAFSGTTSDYKYKQVGTDLEVYNAAGVLVTKVGLQDDTNGTLLTFANGTVDAKFAPSTTGLGLTVGGQAVATTAPTAVTIPAANIDVVTFPITAPTLSVASVAATATEGTNAIWTVTLANPATTATTVKYTLTNVAGASNEDTTDETVVGTGVTSSGSVETAPNSGIWEGTLTFAAGATTATLSLPVALDGLAETGEGVSLSLSNPSTNAIVNEAGKSATVTFVDAPATSFTLTSTGTGVEVQEGSTITFTVTPNSAVNTATTLVLNVQGKALGAVTSTASAADFEASPSITFAQGETAPKTITLKVATDTAVEGREAYAVDVIDTTAYATRGNQLTGVITDKLPLLSLTQNVSTVAEGSTVTYTVTSDTPAPTGGITIPFTVAGTATSGTDYTALTASSITIAAGATTGSVTLATIADTFTDGADETVIITLGTAANASVDQTAKTVTTTVTDSSKALGTAEMTLTGATSVGEGSTVTYTVTLGAAAATALSIPYTVTGTATSGTDFTGSTGTISVAAGSKTGTLTLTTVNDSTTEGAETVTLTLGSAGGFAAASGQGAVTTTINDTSVSVTGSSFSLTTGLDNFTGTAGNDTFNGDNTLTQASDIISGGEGVDTFNYTDASTTGVTIPALTVSSIENINFRNVNGSAAVTAVTETSEVTFGALTNGQTVILGGLTFTAAAAGATAIQVAAAFTAGVANAVNAGGAVGATIAGTLTGYTAAAGGTTSSTKFTSSVAGNVVDMANTGTGAIVAVSTVQGVAASAGSSITDTVSATNFPGATNFNSNVSTGGVDFTNLAAGQQVTVTGNTSVLNGNVGVGYANTVATGTINIAGGTKQGTITETGTGITSNTINSTGAANVLTNVVLSGTNNTALTINATTNLTTGNITGFTGTTSTITVQGAATSVSIGTIENTTVKTINASGLTAGGVTATLSTNTGIIFTGGAGNDAVTAGAVLVTGALVDAAAGTADRLVITADAQLTTATSAFYKNFEILQANTGVTADVTLLAANNAITGVRVNDSASGTVAINNLNATQAANVSIIAANDATGAITLGLTGASNGGQIDTVKAALTTTTSAGAAQVSNLTGIVLTGVEKLELTGNGTAASTTGAITLTTSGATSLDSIKLSTVGAATVTVSATHTAQNLVVDATASTGDLLLDGQLYPAGTTTGLSLLAGSGKDVLLGGTVASTRDNLSAGAGNDSLAGEGGTVASGGALFTAIGANTGSDILTGGLGNDVFGISSVVALGTLDTITDLDLGTNALAGQVDRIVIDAATPAANAAGIVTLSAAEQTAITAAADFATAVGLAAGNATLAATANMVTTFTYASNTYLLSNGVAAGAFDAAADAVIKITGFTGTLDISDIVII